MEKERTMRHTIVAWMEDKPGVLNRVVSLFRQRNFNIESLTVGHSETPGISRMTVVVDATRSGVDQVEKQLFKLVNVTRVLNVTEDPTVVRELALIKVRTTTQTRADIMQLANIYRARIVDVALDALVIEITGPETKVDSLIQLLSNYGIAELVRTGRVAMVRGGNGHTGIPQDMNVE